MANTYTKLYAHLVFAVKYRAAMIGTEWKTDLLKFTTKVIEYNQQKTMRINCVEDHMHILVGMNSRMSVADLMREVKANSSRFVNEHKFVPVRFEWQEGYGGFSVSPYDVPRIIEYIKNQEEHHKHQNLRDEYLAMLKENGVDFDPNYIFTDPR